MSHALVMLVLPVVSEKKVSFKFEDVWMPAMPRMQVDGRHVHPRRTGAIIVPDWANLVIQG